MIDETLSELLVSTTQETTQEKLIALIKENPSITQGELAVKLGVTRDGFVQISWHVWSQIG